MAVSDVLHEFLSRPARTLTLDRARCLYDRVLGRTRPAFGIVHVAGTNGKGSVSGKIHSCLWRSGFRVGLYTSPHIWSIHDRIQINGDPIPHLDLVQYLHRIHEQHDRDQDPVTTFEALTITAIQYFRDQRVDFAIIEAGLGGTLDATNVVHPSISVITSIGLDHCEYLGDSIEEICRHKAGIIKDHIPIITGPTVPSEIIAPIAAKHHAPHYHIEINPQLSLSYDLENIAIATKALDLLQVPYDHNQLNYSPPCRFQMIDYQVRRIVLDAAHNQAAFNALCSRLQSLLSSMNNSNLHLILGMSSDKMNPDQAIRSFTPLNPVSINIVAAHGNIRAWNPVQIVADHNREGLVRCIDKGNIQSTLEQVILNSNPGDVIVICGSFYIMREAQEYFNMTPESDHHHDQDIAALYDACIRPNLKSTR